MTKKKTAKIRKRIRASQRLRSGTALRGANARGASPDTRLTRPGDDLDTRSNVRSRLYRGSGLSRSYSIKTIAEAKEVSPRTVRRWIETGKLIRHRIGGVVRISEDDFRAFWASYRDA